MATAIFRTLVLVVLWFSSHLALPATGSPISDVTATASSTISGFDRLPMYAVNGNGLSGDAHTSVADGNMWQGEVGLSTFTMDLRRVFDLTELRVWNYNEISSSHGVKTGHIEVSFNGVVWNQVVANQLFSEAPHVNGYNTPDVIQLPANTQGRFVRFDFTENFSTRSALGEVQAFGTRVLPSVPGFTVDVYASVDDPFRLSFDGIGNLFVGRDNTGSGGLNQDPLRIHHVGVGGSPISEYGVAPIADPDAVLFDDTGAISGTAGSVLVGGIPQSSNIGRISAILPDETVSHLFDLGSGTNPNDMAFDSTDRLIFTDNKQPGRILSSTGGGAATLHTFPSLRRARSLAVDSSDRIFVVLDDGTISVHASDGSLLNPAFATGLSGGTALAFGPGGVFGTDLYALSDGSLLRYDDLGNSMVVGTGFAPSLPGQDIMGGIEFGPDGALYVAEFTEDQLLRVIPEPSTFILSILGLIGLSLRRPRIRFIA